MTGTASPDSIEPVLRTEHLRRSYGGRVVVDDFSIDVEPGEIAVLVGPNGCGKTTSVEMALGLRRPDSGRSFVCGVDVNADPRRARRSVGVALQGGYLNARVRVREHLQFFDALYGFKNHSFDIAHMLGLDRKVMRALFGSLSGGQQRRVMVAVALASDPAVAVLDEPTSGVDIESRIALWGALRQLQVRNNTAYLVTTHDLNEAEQYADRVVVMRTGRVVFSGRSDQLVRDSGLRVVLTVRARSELDTSAMPLSPGVRLRRSVREISIGFQHNGDTRDLRHWVASMSIPGGVTMSERAATFEDAYLLKFEPVSAASASPTADRDPS